MIRATIFFAGITTLAVLWLYAEWRTAPLRQWAAAPARAARWLLADLQWHRAARQAWAAGAELVRGVEMLVAAADPTPGSQPRCPRCGGRRCGPHQAGLDCGSQRAPSLSTPLAGTGAHEARYRTPVPRGWLPPRVAWQPLAARIGALPPIGVLP